MELQQILPIDDAMALRAFMQHLFDKTNNVCIEMRLVDQYTKKAEQQFFHIDAWEEAMLFGCAVEGFNVYLGMAPRFDDGSGRKSNCVRLNVLWCDVDNPTDLMGGAWPENVPQPSQVWSSGGFVGDMPKMHFYWFLEDNIDRDQFETAESIMRALASILHGDRNCADISRAMRMPGSLNHKYQPAARSQCIADYSRLHCLDDFLELVKHDPLRLESEVWEKRRKERELKHQALEERRLRGEVSEPLELVDPISVMCQHCSLMADCRATGGNLSEPLWFAALSNLAAFADHGADPHSFSNGYPRYKFTETERKWMRAQDNVQRYGPVGCGKIATEGGCSGCRFQGDIKSPAGIPYKVAVEQALARRKEREEQQRRQASAGDRISHARKVASMHTIVYDPMARDKMAVENQDFI